MMENLVSELASLKASLKDVETLADHAAVHIDVAIVDIMNRLEDLKNERKAARAPYEHDMAELNTQIDAINEDIMDAWDGDKRMVRYPEGLLKFRTTRRVHDMLTTETTSVSLEVN